MTEYGNRLKSARADAGLTQMQLSAITGIRQSTISTAEREGNGSAETTVYAKALGVNAHWLATGEGLAKPKAPEPWVAELVSMLDAIDPAARVGMLTHFRWYIEKFGQSNAPQGESPPVETMAAYAERRRNPAPSRLNKINPIKKRNE